MAAVGARESDGWDDVLSPGRGPLLGSRARTRTEVVGLVLLLTLAVVVLDLPTAWHAAGLGLLLPGAGLLYTGDPLLAVVTFVATLALVPRLVSRGDYVGAPAVMAAGACAAAWRSDDGVWPWVTWLVTLAFAVSVGTLVMLRRRTARDAARTRERRAAVAAAPLTLRSAIETGGAPELTPDELAFHRWMLDHALRPRDDWSSFDRVDQYSLAGLRYQLNFLQWSLALASHSRTPAFAGYSHVAQRNLIERMTQRTVWSYWQRENLWGNLRMSPDPIARDNIMFSGYLALMLGAYVATTGDRRYDQEGSLTFAWSRSRTYRYDHTRIIEAVERNFRRSPWGLFACEPGLIFPLCNAVAMLGLAASDAVAGTTRGEGLLPDFVRGLNEEFTHPDGDVALFIATRLGMRADFMRSPHATAQLGFFLNPLLPEVSQRWWTIARSELVDTGRLRPENLSGSGERIIGDWGTGKPSHASMYASVLTLAREVGDEDAYRLVLEAADHHLGWSVRDGVGCYERCSVNANALLGLARFGGSGAFRGLVHSGSAKPGPRLADVDYPQVLVAAAVTDGQDLRLVLYPGAGPGRVTLQIGHLQPGREYSLHGGVEAEVYADQRGRTAIEIDLEERTAVAVSPAVS